MPHWVSVSCGLSNLHVPRQICAFTSMTVVILSTLTFVLSNMPELTEEVDIVLFDNETETEEASVERWHQVTTSGCGLQTYGNLWKHIETYRNQSIGHRMF